MCEFSDRESMAKTEDGGWSEVHHDDTEEMTNRCCSADRGENIVQRSLDHPMVGQRALVTAHPSPKPYAITCTPLRGGWNLGMTTRLRDAKERG